MKTAVKQSFSPFENAAGTEEQESKPNYSPCKGKDGEIEREIITVKKPI